MARKILSEPVKEPKISGKMKGTPSWLSLVTECLRLGHWQAFMSCAARMAAVSVKNISQLQTSVASIGN